MVNFEEYPQLAPCKGWKYRKVVLKGTGLGAFRIYELVHGPDALSPEEVATGFRVPIEAVREALAFMEKHLDEYEAEVRRDEEDFDATRPDDHLESIPESASP